MSEPDRDCPLCPRLAQFRTDNRRKFPDFFNGPVPSFGDTDARLLVVGLAPGLKGANWSGRPFTGDAAGNLLYPTLIAFGFASGTFGARPDDGLTLRDCRITNAVRCVPPQNKPTTPEIATCLAFLREEFALLTRLKVVLALGLIAHGAVLTAFGQKKAAYKFAHGAIHQLPDGTLLTDSYHCSRYNTNTGRLTPAMFEAVFWEIRERLAS